MPTYVLIVGVAFLAMGFIGLFKPVTMAAFFDGNADNISVRNEIRAVYGGFGICTGILLLSAAELLPELALGIYAATGVALGGMALGRLLSSIIEIPGPLLWLYMFLEALCAAMMLSLAFG